MTRKGTALKVGVKNTSGPMAALLSGGKDNFMWCFGDILPGDIFIFPPRDPSLKTEDDEEIGECPLHQKIPVETDSETEQRSNYEIIRGIHKGKKGWAYDYAPVLRKNL